MADDNFLPDGSLIEDYILSNRKKIGESLRELREVKGFNQEQLAEIMKISRTTISKIENGKFNCSVDYLSKFSWFLRFEIKLEDKSLRL